ncbi:unnamed protein product [Dicrocoelium dendriticum]|nr:unnamed protein product [Dicrocoelium dendriticum]
MDELRKAKGEFEAIMSEGVTSFMPVHKAESFLRYQSRALANRQCEEENMKCLRLLQLADDYRVPEVTCFIQNVIKEQTLERKQAIWNQRRRMAEVMYKRQRSLLSKIWTEKEKQAQLTSKCQ